MESKYASEEIWRKSLALQRGQLRRLLTPEWEGYGIKDRAKAQHRIDRIWNAGLPEWQERDNAQRS